LVWALENLVKNALDALAGRGGRIHVAATRAGDDAIRFIVSDNGPGIAPGIRDRLFSPGATTKSGGWGVGLSLTRRIVEDVHDGTIAVRPRRGGGTIFDIRLPTAPLGEAEADAADGARSTAEGTASSA
ncbi:MAG: ATP-binding protein, partial [Gemmatimonadota bacterium]